jgi:hypothetical protein
MAHRGHPEDFNAFGYDPRGRVANIAGLTFGEHWRPDQQDIPHHDGPEVAPPRYGPPADYQRSHLPINFVPRLPHDGYLGALQYQRREGPWAHYPPPPMPLHPPPTQLQREYYRPAPQQVVLPDRVRQQQQAQPISRERPNRWHDYQLVPKQMDDVSHVCRMHFRQQTQFVLLRNSFP